MPVALAGVALFVLSWPLSCLEFAASPTCLPVGVSGVLARVGDAAKLIPLCNVAATRAIFRTTNPDFSLVFCGS